LAPGGIEVRRGTGLIVQRAELLRRRIQVLEQAQNGALAPLKTKALAPALAEQEGNRSAL
jgi:hypothetical protein